MMEIVKARIFNRNLGLVFSNDEPWNVMRRFTIRTLRTFGFGKASSMDVVTNQELDKFFEQIKTQMEANPKGGIQAENMFTQTIVHVIWRLLTGAELELGNKKIQRFLHITDELAKTLNFGFDICVAYPFLWNMFPKWPGKTNQMKRLNEMNDFAKGIIKEHKESEVYKVDPECYVDAFLAKIEESKEDPKSEFNDDLLLLCFLDLTQAGTDSVSNSLSFSMLYMVLNKKIQEKVQNEIDANVGKKEMITADMKARLPYTHATLLECFRMTTVAPFPPARMATEDFYFKGYLIKKGTAILPNLQAANHSKDKWGDPHNFRPERFLAEDGTVDPKVASFLVNFGFGKRACLGQSLAESSIFIYFTSLLRKFKLEKVAGQQDPSVEPVIGAFYFTQPFQLRFIERK